MPGEWHLGGARFPSDGADARTYLVGKDGGYATGDGGFQEGAGNLAIAY